MVGEDGTMEGGNMHEVLAGGLGDVQDALAHRVKLRAGLRRVASVKSRGESLRPDVPPLPGFKSFRDVKTVTLPVDAVVDGIPKVTEQWRDTFGG